MPRWSRPIADAEGNVVGIACGRSPDHWCSTPGCSSRATIQCDYPVQRRGKNGTCDRWTCRTHAKSVGRDCDYCLPHANLKEEPTDPAERD